MQNLQELRLKTKCSSCVNKCCSEPFDWVFLTSREIARLQAASGLAEEQFVVQRQNKTTGHVFRTLNLPCRFLDSKTGQCTVYESRPLVCQIFPFYPEPMTGDATLLPTQCGDNLDFLDVDSNEGWRLMDYEADVRTWLAELWKEAASHPLDAISTTRMEGSP
jgi:Fe-S-cluster containining protein